MRDHFTGMSINEMKGMPLTIEATANMLAPKAGVSLRIAKAQHEYVQSVFDRCPSWRWRKKRKLGLALDHAERVRHAIEAAA